MHRLANLSPRQLATVRLVGMLSATSISACQPGPGGASANSGSPPPPTDSELARLDRTISSFFALGAAPGMSVVVVRDTGPIYMKGFGFADLESRRQVTPQTVFYVASTTKSFTALGAAMLDREGRISLDAPLSRYLPALSLRHPLTADSITMRSLLTHTHGIAGGPVSHRLAYTGEYESNAHLLRLLAEHEPLRTGRAFSYGNAGYNIATLAIDSAVNESWKDWLNRLLFVPLGMRSTTAYVSRIPQERLAMPYRIEPTGFARMRYGKGDANMQSAGGLVTSAEDMARWLEAHINRGRVDGRQVIPADVVDEAHRVLATANASSRGMRQVGYGLGWNIMILGSDTALVHGGGFPGFTTHMSFVPRHRIGVVVMTNANGPLADVVAHNTYATLLGDAGPPPMSIDDATGGLARMREQIAADRARRAARPQTLPLPRSAYTGTYENPTWGRITIEEVDGRLEARAGQAWSAVEVYDHTKHQLRVELTGSGVVMTMEVEGDRAVAAVIDGTRFTRVKQ